MHDKCLRYAHFTPMLMFGSALRDVVVSFVVCVGAEVKPETGTGWERGDERASWCAIDLSPPLLPLLNMT